MILVDTSVWIDHLRNSNGALVVALNAGEVFIHPYVLGELALGNLQNRDVILEALNNLPKTNVATDEEVLAFIAQHRLHGLGIGYVDAHLLAGTLLTLGARLWTSDKRLRTVASQLGVLHAQSEQ